MPARFGGAEALRRVVLCCVPEARAKSRVQSALRGHATIEWFDTFADVRRAITRDGRAMTVVIGMSDGRGGTALSFTEAVRADSVGTSIVVCCSLDAGNQQPISELAAAGVHDILFTGVNDDGHTARMVIFSACLGGAADLVMNALRPTIPAGLVRFVDVAVRRPRELRRVAEVADALNVPRQTIGRWCRGNEYLRPEELLVWTRLFLVAALLETTERTLESIASELRYGSPTALRNRLREYTGLTSTQVRDGGLRAVLGIFASRLAELRGGAGARGRASHPAGGPS